MSKVIFIIAFAFLACGTSTDPVVTRRAPRSNHLRVGRSRIQQRIWEAMNALGQAEHRLVDAEEIIRRREEQQQAMGDSEGQQVVVVEDAELVPDDLCCETPRITDEQFRRFGFAFFAISAALIVCFIAYMFFIA